MNITEIHTELNSASDMQHDLNGSAKKSVVYALYKIRSNFEDNFMVVI